MLSVLSILIMPTLAYLKGRTGREMRSRALVADSVETWVCAYLSVALLATVGLNAAFGWWADPVGALAMLPVILWQGWEMPAVTTRSSDLTKKDNGTRWDRQTLRSSNRGSAAWRLAWMVVGALFFFVMAYGLNWT